MPILSIMRDAGVSPSIVRITTTETLAEITAPEYLKTQTEAIQQINFGPFEWVDGDLVSIDYADGEGFFSYDSVNQAFVQSGGGGGGDGANKTLSNLEAPTAVNQDIVPDGDRTRALGSETNRFQEVYLGDWRVPHNVDDPFPDNATISVWNSGTNAWEPLAAFLSGLSPSAVFYKPTVLMDGRTLVALPPGDNSRKLADTAFVQQELAAYVPPAPPSPDWGDITGTLSNQTDLQNALNSKADSSSLEAYATLLCNLNAAVDPTAGDDSGDGYDIGSRWINVNTNKEFVCVDDAVGSAIWEETTGGAPFDRYTYETSSSSSRLQMRSSISSGGIRNIYLPTSEAGTYTYTFSQSSANAQIPLLQTGIITNMSANNGNFMPTRVSPSVAFQNNLVGTFRTPYALMNGAYVFPYGCRGIDTSKVGIAAVPNRIYLVPMLVRSESLLFSFGVESITGTMSVLVRPYEMNGNVMANNVAGNVAANVVSMTVSSPGIYTFPNPSTQVRGLFWIAIQVTGSNTMSLAGCIEEDAGALAPFLGCSAKDSATPVFGFYIDGFGLISSSTGLEGTVPDGILTSGIGICAEKA